MKPRWPVSASWTSIRRFWGDLAHLQRVLDPLLGVGGADDDDDRRNAGEDDEGKAATSRTRALRMNQGLVDRCINESEAARRRSVQY